MFIDSTPAYQVSAGADCKSARYLEYLALKGKVEMNTEINQPEKARKKGCGIAPLVALVVLAGLAWIAIRPGVFTIQPIGALPEGVTVIYHSRNPEMPFFSSPDGLCLELQGSVTLLCRAAAISALDELNDRILIRLPYSHRAYLRSTGGLEFVE